MIADEVILKAKTMDVLADLTILFSDFYVEMARNEELIKQLRSEIDKHVQRIQELESKIKDLEPKVKSYEKLKAENEGY